MNQGCKGATESPEAYFRFVRFLHLGSERTASMLARLLDVTPQAVARMAKKFNWAERAAAFDRARRRGKAELPLLQPPDPVPPADPPRRSPPTARRPPSITPEVLPQHDPEAMALAGDHVAALRKYHAHYERLGWLMAEEAEQCFPLVRAFREDLDAARQAWRKLVDQGEVQLAQVLCLQLQQLVPLYCRLSEAMHNHANGGRTHWGDAIGVQRILQEVLAADAEAQKREGKG
jgi:hypothetical protein